MLISVFATGGQPSKQPCLDEATMYRQSDGGVCLFESMSLFFFSLAGVLFWFASALDLYLKIVLTLRIDPLLQSRLNLLYRIVGWGIPILLLIIALSMEGFGGSPGVSWCFFSGVVSESVEWGLFYYPSAKTKMLQRPAVA